MNRLFKTILCSLSLFLATGVLSSCSWHNVSHPGTMDDIKGVYKLTTKTRRDEENNDVDALASDHVLAYLCITGEERGYYYYKDDNTEEYVTEVWLDYIPDDEEENKYSAVRYFEGDFKKGDQSSANKGTVWAWLQQPGGGEEPQMGVNNKMNTLSYTVSHEAPAWYNSYHEIDYLYVCYSKVSSTGDFASLKQAVGKELQQPIDILLKNLSYHEYGIGRSSFGDPQVLVDNSLSSIDFKFNEDFSSCKVYTQPYPTEQYDQYTYLETVSVVQGNSTFNGGPSITFTFTTSLTGELTFYVFLNTNRCGLSMLSCDEIPLGIPGYPLPNE